MDIYKYLNISNLRIFYNDFDMTHCIWDNMGNNLTLVQ